MNSFRSRGIRHHADVTVTCPRCSHRFQHPHHTAVTEFPGEVIEVQFKSKQDERWGVLRIARPRPAFAAGGESESLVPDHRGSWAVCCVRV